MVRHIYVLLVRFWSHIYSYNERLKKVKVHGRCGEHLKKRQLEDLVEEGQSVVSLCSINHRAIVLWKGPGG